jgi:Spy/CpxP family protein refolding chaperone
MISIRSLASVSLLGLLVALAGCSGEAGTATGSETAAQNSAPVAQTAQAPRAMHGVRRGGQASLLVAALHAPINLSAEQTATIKSALATLKPEHTTKPAFDSSRKTALAASIRAGKVDMSAMPAPAAKSADFTARMAARKTAMASALTTLHDTLTPDQRKALVDSMANKHASFKAAKVNEEGAREGHGRSHDFMGGMLRDLDLTQAQKDAIHAKLSANRPVFTAEQKADMKAQWTAKRETFEQDRQAKLQSFVSDSFDANAFLAKPASVKTGAHMDRAASFSKNLDAIVSVLDPSQREKLAARIEAGPQARVHAVKVDKATAL